MSQESVDRSQFTEGSNSWRLRKQCDGKFQLASACCRAMQRERGRRELDAILTTRMQVWCYCSRRQWCCASFARELRHFRNVAAWSEAIHCFAEILSWLRFHFWLSTITTSGLS